MASKNKKKVVIKDEYGTRWFVNTKTQEVKPTHWKLDCYLQAQKRKKK